MVAHVFLAAAWHAANHGTNCSLAHSNSPHVEVDSFPFFVSGHPLVDFDLDLALLKTPADVPLAVATTLVARRHSLIGVGHGPFSPFRANTSTSGNYTGRLEFTCALIDALAARRSVARRNDSHGEYSLLTAGRADSGNPFSSLGTLRRGCGWRVLHRLRAVVEGSREWFVTSLLSSTPDTLWPRTEQTVAAKVLRSQNMSDIFHPKLHYLPLGVSKEWAVLSFEYLQWRVRALLETNETLRWHDTRPQLLYVNFRLRRASDKSGVMAWNDYERQRALDRVRAAFAREGRALSNSFSNNFLALRWMDGGAKRRLSEIYTDGLLNSKFVMSPIGWGVDCYRTWEALASGAVPIVDDTPLMVRVVPSPALTETTSLPRSPASNNKRARFLIPPPPPLFPHLAPLIFLRCSLSLSLSLTHTPNRPHSGAAARTPSCRPRLQLERRHAKLPRGRVRAASR